MNGQVAVSFYVCAHCGGEAPGWTRTSAFPHYAGCPVLGRPDIHAAEASSEPTETSGDA